MKIAIAIHRNAIINLSISNSSRKNSEITTEKNINEQPGITCIKIVRLLWYYLTYLSFIKISLL